MGLREEKREERIRCEKLNWGNGRRRKNMVRGSETKASRKDVME